MLKIQCMKKGDNNASAKSRGPCSEENINLSRFRFSNEIASP